MRAPFQSHFAAALLGGLVVAGSFAAIGVSGEFGTRTVIQQSPVEAQESAAGGGLTPHAIYERDAPGVVFVKAMVVQQVAGPFNLFPVKEQSSSTGSGFLIDQAGYVLTNFHLIEGANPSIGVSVEFEDNVSRHATVVGVDQNNDLALLKVDMSGVPLVRPLALGESSSVRVGDATLAIGNPFGYDRTLTSGIVSALQRQIQGPNGFAIDNVIQTDAPINPGNSGGPLLDAAGRVIGINSQIVTGANGGGGSIGIAFAVPIDTAKAFIPRVEARSTLTSAKPEDSQSTTSAGVLINQAPGGTVAAVGLRHGDSVTAIDGRRVGSIGQVRAILAAAHPGQRMRIELKRAGRVLALAVKLGSRHP